MTTSTKSETAAKKDVTKLQRAIVDGLEDVKAQDIQVFNTEQLSPLFERVIVASGTSNRQTKALAASVRDAVKEAGFAKPRIEGEDNGEWIIVDCGPAVAHIMQPAIRQYYRLEELWGETPVRLKLGAAKPEAAAKKAPARKKAASAAADAVPARKPGKPKVAAGAAAAAAPAAAKKAAAKKAPAKTVAGKTAAGKPASAGAAKAPAAKKPVVKTVVVKPGAKKPAAKKAAAKAAPKSAAKPAAKAPVKAAAKTPAKKAPGRSSAASSKKA